MHVHRAGLEPVRDLGPDVPCLLQELSATLGPPLPLQEGLEEAELGRRERHFLAVQRRLMGREIEAERPCPEDPPPGRRPQLTTPTA